RVAGRGRLRVATAGGIVAAAAGLRLPGDRAARCRRAPAVAHHELRVRAGEAVQRLLSRMPGAAGGSACPPGPAGARDGYPTDPAERARTPWDCRADRDVRPMTQNDPVLAGAGSNDTTTGSALRNAPIQPIAMPIWYGCEVPGADYGAIALRDGLE